MTTLLPATGERRLRVLAMAVYYLPGYKAGGPIRSLSNLVEWLGSEIEFYFITTDRDSFDEQPYPSIIPDQWQQVGRAWVRYVPPRQQGFFAWWRLLTRLQLDYDVLYLNSFFAHMTRNTLLLYRLGVLPRTPIVMAPRGEISSGALRLKSLKKSLYVMAAKLTGLYRGVIWQAANEEEAEEFRRVFGSGITVAVAAYPFPKEGYARIAAAKPTKHPGAVRIAFLSRITPKKNLALALGACMPVRGQVMFDIYGGISDPDYWEQCQQIIRALPPDVTVTYRSTVPNERVVEVLHDYHLFIMPTLDDNYGRVVLEALSAGCVTITSDQIPWRGLEERGIGWNIPLDDPAQISRAVQTVLEMDDADFQPRARAARLYVEQILSDNRRIDDNRRLFMGAVGRAAADLRAPS